MKLARSLVFAVVVAVVAYLALLRLAVALDYWESKHRPLRLADKPKGVKFYEWRDSQPHPVGRRRG